MIVLKKQLVLQKKSYSDDYLVLNVKNRENITGEEILRTIQNPDRKFTISFRNKFLGVLLDEQRENRWVDIESLYYDKILKIYYNITKQNVPKNEIGIFQEELINLNKDFDDIKSLLYKYLKQINETIINNRIINYKISGLISEFKGKFNNRDQKYENELYFLNFNYTHTIELYDKIEGVKTTVNYIHGNLRDGKNENLIFGYGDEKDVYYEKIERLNNNEFIKNFKSFGYFKTNNYNNLIRFLGRKFNVRILGHSCGISDKILLNTIFEHANCNRIYAYYYQRKDGSNDYYEKTMELSRHFKDKAKMREKIVSFESCKPLLNFN